MIAKLTAESLSIWDGERLVIWSPGTDSDKILEDLGYRRQTEWILRDGYWTATVE